MLAVKSNPVFALFVASSLDLTTAPIMKNKGKIIPSFTISNSKLTHSSWAEIEKTEGSGIEPKKNILTVV